MTASTCAPTVPGAPPTSRAGTPPRLNVDHPDPEILRVGGVYYSYSTNTGVGGNVPVHRSTDLSTWTRSGDALRSVGSWAYPGRTWAPAVERFGNTYLLYYTAHHRASGLQCIGRATATSPTGPFVDRWNAPLVCQTQFGGSIDAETFRHGGRTYLLWKSDENAPVRNRPPRLWVRQLRADGLVLTGPGAKPLLSQQRSWEAPLIEQPAMVRASGRFWLFYSARNWNSAQYATGYAICTSPVGPCTRATMNGPFHATTSHARGPGAMAFFTEPDGATFVAYHGWTGGVGSGRRALFIDRMTFTSAAPRLRPFDRSSCSSACDSPISRRHAALGGNRSMIGRSTSAERAVHSPHAAGGRVQVFQAGTIYWSPSTGARAVWGRILTQFAARGGIGGSLRYPTSHILSTPDGRTKYTIFQGGRIYSFQRERYAVTVTNAFQDKHWAVGGVRGVMGYPIANARPIHTPRGGDVQLFEKGRMYRINNTVYQTHGSIDAFHQSAGGIGGQYSYPVTDIMHTGDGRGRTQWFEGGLVWSVPSEGITGQGLHGDTLERYLTNNTILGLPTVPWIGYPTRSTAPVGDGLGTFAEFQYGVIYATPQLGGHQIHGAVADLYLQLGGPAGTLGYPTSELTTAGPFGERRQTFEHGVIVLQPDGSAALEPAGASSQGSRVPDVFRSTDPSIGVPDEPAGPANGSAHEDGSAHEELEDGH